MTPRSIIYESEFQRVSMGITVFSSPGGGDLSARPGLSAGTVTVTVGACCVCVVVVVCISVAVTVAVAVDTDTETTVTVTGP